MNRRAGFFLLVCLSGLLFGALVIELFYKLPPVWPDEAEFYQPALMFLQHGRLQMPLLEGVVPGIEMRTYWQPCFYYFYGMLFLPFFSAPLTAVRVSSIVAGYATVLILTGTIVQRLKLRRETLSPLAAVPILLLITEPMFVRGSLIGRMDALTLACVMGGLLTFVQSLEEARSIGWRRFLAGASGLLLSLGLQAHLIGLAGVAAVGIVLLMGRRTPPERLALKYCLTTFAIALLPWAFYIWQEPDNFLQQMALQFGQKSTRQAQVGSWRRFRESILDQFPLNGYGFLIHAIFGTLGLWQLARDHKSWRVYLIALSLFFAFNFYALEIWYPLYLLPFLSLGYLGWFEDRQRLVRYSMLLIAVVIISMNSLALWRIALSTRSQDYFAWADHVAENYLNELPAGSRVLLWSIPDLYPALSQKPLPLRYFHFASLQLTPAHRTEFLNSMDVIAIGGRLRKTEFETFFAEHPNAWRSRKAIHNGNGLTLYYKTPEH